MQTFLRGTLTILLTAPVLSMAAGQPAPSEKTAPANKPVAVTQQLPETKGVTSWKILAQVKQVRVKDRILPEFSQEVAALHEKKIKVRGFMTPLEPGEKQKHFLISVAPQSCSFCLPAGPEGVIEVKTTTPVDYTIEPVVVSGKLNLLKDDPMGMYYRLTDATPVSTK